MAAQQPQPDMFDHARLDAARQVVRAAEAARDEAKDRVLGAPHGKYRERWAVYYKAAHDLVRAEVAFSRLKRELGL